MELAAGRGPGAVVSWQLWLWAAQGVPCVLCPRRGESPSAPRVCRCRCGLSHPLEDEDVVQIVKKKVTEGAPPRAAPLP